MQKLYYFELTTFGYVFNSENKMVWQWNISLDFYCVDPGGLVGTNLWDQQRIKKRLWFRVKKCKHLFPDAGLLLYIFCWNSKHSYTQVFPFHIPTNASLKIKQNKTKNPNPLRSDSKKRYLSLMRYKLKCRLSLRNMSLMNLNLFFP